MSQVDVTWPNSYQDNGLTEAIAWAKSMMAHNCRGRAEIRFLKILVEALEENKNEDPGTD